MAMENDDLELALKYKKEIGIVAKQLEPQQQERNWFEKGYNAEIKGISLNEIANSISRLNQKAGEIYKFKFLAPESTPTSREPILTRMNYFVIAKRYAKMILKIYSTNIEYPKFWISMLQNVNSKVFLIRIPL
jgi:hypothetical protein